MVTIVYKVAKTGHGFYLFEDQETVCTPERGELIVDGLWSEGVELIDEHGEYIQLTDEEFFDICRYNGKCLYGGKNE